MQVCNWCGGDGDHAHARPSIVLRQLGCQHRTHPKSLVSSNAQACPCVRLLIIFACATALLTPISYPTVSLVACQGVMGGAGVLLKGRAVLLSGGRWQPRPVRTGA
jgi:hypothetical protein